MSTSSEIMDLEDSARLELTLRVREKAIKEIVKSGDLPKDQSDRAFLVQMLDGMDRTVLSKAKIKSDKETAKNQSDSAKLIADALMRVDSRRVSQRRLESIDNVVLPEIKLVEGETLIGVQSFKYDDIVGST